MRNGEFTSLENYSPHLIRRMGHAGAIVGGKDDTAAAKMAIMAECGIHVVASPAEIGQKMAEVLGRMPA